MKNNTLALTALEKSILKKNGIKLKEITNYSVDELSSVLNIPMTRTSEIYALTEFQTIPSIGIKFAEDLISLGYYSLNDLKDKNGADMINDLEILTNTWIDPCVEDQCRLVVYYANHGDRSKNWWDFTAERKKYRAENGYPDTRPKKAWFEVV